MLGMKFEYPSAAAGISDRWGADIIRASCRWYPCIRCGSTRLPPSAPDPADIRRITGRTGIRIIGPCCNLRSSGINCFITRLHLIPSKSFPPIIHSFIILCIFIRFSFIHFLGIFIRFFSSFIFLCIFIHFSFIHSFSYAYSSVFHPFIYFLMHIHPFFHSFIHLLIR